MLKVFVSIILIVTLSACEKKNQMHEKIITVTEESRTEVLYYTGIIHPSKTIVITSPIDGVIVDMPFSYGENIKKNQLLFTLSSTKFNTDYKSSVMQYLKTKNDFNTSKIQLQEGEFLHKNGLISDDDFKMKQSNFYSAQLAFLQSTDNLENLLKEIHAKDIDLKDITIENTQKIKQVMNLKMATENLKITSPKSGIILAMIKNDEYKKLNFGDTVKEGDVLAQIGDMRSLNVNIKVNELIINQIKLGQKVSVEGMAFEDQPLSGEITKIDKQAEVSNANLPAFNVVVTVKDVINEKIYPGMSAKVVIRFTEKPKIVLPINALQEKDNEFFAFKWDEQKQKKLLTPIKLNKTTTDKVIVQSGLSKGDQVIVPN